MFIGLHLSFTKMDTRSIFLSLPSPQPALPATVLIIKLHIWNIDGDVKMYGLNMY